MLQPSDLTMTEVAPVFFIRQEMGKLRESVTLPCAPFLGQPVGLYVSKEGSSPPGPAWVRELRWDVRCEVKVMDSLRLRVAEMGVDEPRARWNCSPGCSWLALRSQHPKVSLSGHPVLQQLGWLPPLQDPTWNFQRRLWVLKVGQETKPFPGSFGTKLLLTAPRICLGDMLCNVVRCVGPEQSGLGKEQVLSLFFF